MKDEINIRQPDLRERSRRFALRIIRVYAALPFKAVAQVLGKQMLRSGTAVGANYREACRSRSDAEFNSKLEGALQELDETEYWLELLVDADVIAANRLTPLLKEVNELIAIFTTCVKKAISRQRRD
jgi:four helix bundle protein